MGINIIFSAFFIFATIFQITNAEPIRDKQALIDFIRAVSLTPPLDWNASSSPCTNWKGITCNQEKSRVIGLKLNRFHFWNRIPEHTLGRLTALRVLNLGMNYILGPLPFDLSNFRNLAVLNLEDSNLSGALPFDFSILKNLSVVNLSNNAFNGTIPSSFSNLTQLKSLNLANNSFSGPIPDFGVPTLQFLDLSNNNLTGNIPPTLQNFPSWVFLGNNLGNSTPVGRPKSPKKLKKSEKIGIIIGGCMLVSFTLVILLIVIYLKKDNINGGPSYSGKNKDDFMKKEGSTRGNQKLVFSEGCNYFFDLEDLLRASAEVLGKGMFGTTYKAALEDTSTVVVKRVKEMSVSKRDFDQIMGLVGSITHDNVINLRAYYYSKEEKLMVYDYYGRGSVAAMLHSKRSEDRVPLDWETRLRIVIGVARGIAHVHTQNNGKLVHGNVKASNIFLNSQGFGSISDLGLAILMSPTIPPSARSGGYIAPEVTDTRKATQPSDVYSFGVFLLELLTGKSPVHATGGEYDVIHLVRWVNSVVREEWTAEVFDVELMRYPNIEEEMVEMLQIGLSCAARMPEQRPKMTDVVSRVEDIRRVGGENPSSSESNSLRSTPSPTPNRIDQGRN